MSEEKIKNVGITKAGNLFTEYEDGKITYQMPKSLFSRRESDKVPVFKDPIIEVVDILDELEGGEAEPVLEQINTAPTVVAVSAEPERRTITSREWIGKWKYITHYSDGSKDYTFLGTSPQEREEANKEIYNK